MTAEIAVMNTEAVALAADSAVTMRTRAGPKIYQSANKIFRLSRSAPIALMVYDSANFLHVPWETIAKSYRAARGEETFGKLTDHAQDFLRFMKQSKLLFPDDAREQHTRQTVYSLYFGILREIDRATEERLKQGPVSKKEIAEIASQTIKACSDYFAGVKKVRGAPNRDTTRKRLTPAIARARKALFGGFNLTAADSNRLAGIAVDSFSKDREMLVRSPSRAGVVIAGFGSDEIYPSVFEVVVETLLGPSLKAVKEQCTTVGPATLGAAILPFAQREIVDAFLQGIDPGYIKYLRGRWQHVIDTLGTKIADEAGLTGTKRTQVEAATKKHCQDAAGTDGTEIERMIQRDYVSPILDAVLMLPKDELGAMAESLVNLTSFRHKVSREAETVGGPIDVAVISKGDGLIWIKRKHYFEPELNPQYFATRFGGGSDQ